MQRWYTVGRTLNMLPKKFIWVETYCVHSDNFRWYDSVSNRLCRRRPRSRLVNVLDFFGWLQLCSERYSRLSIISIVFFVLMLLLANSTTLSMGCSHALFILSYKFFSSVFVFIMVCLGIIYLYICHEYL